MKSKGKILLIYVAPNKTQASVQRALLPVTCECQATAQCAQLKKTVELNTGGHIPYRVSGPSTLLCGRRRRHRLPGAVIAYLVGGGRQASNIGEK